jgi:SulP family sulfate permease
VRERNLMREGLGRVVIFRLSGDMIFGASRAISRTNSAVEDCAALIVDLREVRHLGVSVSLALESAIIDMLDAGREVFIVGAGEQIIDRLNRLDLLERLPEDHLVEDREEALYRALHRIPG